MEGSREAGGLPFVYAQKSLILILPVLLLIQALVLTGQNLIILRKTRS